MFLMEDLFVPAGIRTPELQFKFSQGSFLIKGESYPEDIKKFYGDPIATIAKHFGKVSKGPQLVVVELKYFNSSTAKILMDLFMMLEASAASGNRIKIEWRFLESDENMRELGSEFGEDLEHVSFELKPFKK